MIKYKSPIFFRTNVKTKTLHIYQRSQISINIHYKTAENNWMRFLVVVKTRYTRLNIKITENLSQSLNPSKFNKKRNNQYKETFER